MPTTPINISLSRKVYFPDGIFSIWLAEGMRARKKNISNPILMKCVDNWPVDNLQANNNIGAPTCNDFSHRKRGKLGCELVYMTKDPDSTVIKGALAWRFSECCELWHLLKVRDALEAENETETRESHGSPSWLDRAWRTFRYSLTSFLSPYVTQIDCCLPLQFSGLRRKCWSLKTMTVP